MSEHRLGEGNSFASKYRCRNVVHIEEYGEVADAIKREKQLKKWNRDWKEALIEQENPEWLELMPED